MHLSCPESDQSPQIFKELFKLTFSRFHHNEIGKLYNNLQLERNSEFMKNISMKWLVLAVISIVFSASTV